MAQPLFLRTWADDTNRYFPFSAMEAWLSWEPSSPWQAKWVECSTDKDAECAAPWLEHKPGSPDEEGVWRSVRVIGRYFCVRALPSGPIRKLAEWDQLDVGRSILLNPKPSDHALELAIWRASYLDREGRGRFDVECRDCDGTMWLKRRE